MGTLISLPQLRVNGNNNSGWIVGSASSEDGASSAFVQMPGQAIQLIGSLDGATGRSVAWSVNNSGKVLGASTTASGEPRHFSWTSFGGLQTKPEPLPGNLAAPS